MQISLSPKDIPQYKIPDLFRQFKEAGAQVTQEPRNVIPFHTILAQMPDSEIVGKTIAEISGFMERRGYRPPSKHTLSNLLKANGFTRGNRQWFYDTTMKDLIHLIYLENNRASKGLSNVYVTVHSARKGDVKYCLKARDLKKREATA